MRFLNRLIELVFGKVEKVQHPFFGEMVDTGDYYECRKEFKSTGYVVEIGLEKVSTGSDQNQIEFFIGLDKNYENLIEAVSPPLQDEIEKMIPGYVIDDFKEVFRLEHIWIPKCDVSPYDWEVGFGEVGELQHCCQLKMKGFKVIGIHIDG